MNEKLKNLVMLGFMTAALSACGSGTEPISAIGDTSQQLPALSTQGYGTFNGPFTAATPYFLFTGVLPTVSPPANGFVVATDATSVTIVHSTRLATKVGNLSAVFARVGDYAVSGSSLGQSTGLQLTVYLDGAPVCPYTYLNSTSRTLIGSPGVVLCQ